jgi:hypothetical protein
MMTGSRTLVPAASLPLSVGWWIPTLDRDRPTSAFGGWSERLALRGAADQQRLTAGGGNGPPPLAAAP